MPDTTSVHWAAHVRNAGYRACGPGGSAESSKSVYSLRSHSGWALGPDVTSLAVARRRKSWRWCRFTRTCDSITLSL